MSAAERRGSVAPREGATQGTQRSDGKPGAVVAGWGIHVPGIDASARLGLPPAGPACPAGEAKTVLGRRGLLWKEPATRLALCAVHHALGLPAGTPAIPDAVDPATAVVVSSNLGNVATVADVARTAHADGSAAVSPMAAPNASSNVIASTVAIWFGWGGPNLTVCSGAPAGADSLALAMLLLATGRAKRVVVVGAEPDDDFAVELHARRAHRAGPLRAAAACLVLVPPGCGTGPELGPVVSVAEPGEGPRAGPDWLGDTYGAEGVLRVAAAVAGIQAGTVAGPVGVVCGDRYDGWRRIDVCPGGAA